MNKKVLAFIFRDDEWLLLKNSPTFSSGADKWYTVTGSIEAEEPLEQTARREVKEETGLVVKRLIDLGWSSFYVDGKIEYEEKLFIAEVEQGDIELSSEHTAYKWVSFDEFIGEIWWEDDIRELVENIKSALSDAGIPLRSGM